MKTKRDYPIFTVTAKGERWLGTGHPWLYASDVQTEPDTFENGGIADVAGAGGKYLGSGFISEKSKIRVRLLSRNANDNFDRAFWQRRVEYAWAYRKSVMNETDRKACRLIFGEADGFPGLTADRFDDVIVTQTTSYGMEKIKPLLMPIIYDTLTTDGENISGIYERDDEAMRQLEGLEEKKGYYLLPDIAVPDKNSVIIEENGVKYIVDFVNGQKTGFYLDQKYNRRTVMNLARGKRVLDCCTHTGSFALCAAMGGADRVTAVDISKGAIEQAKENARLNGLSDKVDFVVSDVFDFLDTVKKGEYDLIILDPPAFTKSRKTEKAAYRGYVSLNTKAMKALRRGGYLASCSCSHFLGEKEFRNVIEAAAKQSSMDVRQIEYRRQAADHPILWNVPETDYLKFYLVQLV